MIKSGDWVILNTRFIHNMLAIVEQTGSLYSMVRLFDRGKEIARKQVLTQELSEAPVNDFYYEKELDYLIDLALDTGDEEWFRTLVEKKVKEHV